MEEMGDDPASEANMEEAPTEASNNAAEQHRDEVAAAAEAAPCHDRASEDAIAQDIDMQRKELIFGSILSSSLLRWFAHVKKIQFGIENPQPLPQ